MNEKIWAWQPFGPDESIYSFSLVGSHYRGFPVIKVTDEEKQSIERGERFTFKYQYQQYVTFDGKIMGVDQELFLNKWKGEK